MYRWTLRHAEAAAAALVPGSGIAGAAGRSDDGEAERVASAAEAVVRQV